MNPFTRFLSRRINNQPLSAFVDHWDTLEALVIRVFKAKQATPEDEAEYRQVRAWLQRHYPQWQAALGKYWPQAAVAGQPAREDPFAYLLTAVQADDYVGNWLSMQMLPAAREALNHLIIEVGDEV